MIPDWWDLDEEPEQQREPVATTDVGDGLTAIVVDVDDWI